MRRLLRRNVGLKLFSLLLAYLAWAAVVGRPEQTSFPEVTVRARAAPEIEVVDYQPKDIKIHLTGDPSALRQEDLQGLFAMLDVTHLGPGEHRYPVSPADIRNVPRGVSVDVIENVVTLTLESRTTKWVEIKISRTGSPAEGFVLEDIRAEPERVSVTGAESRVAPLDSVPTDMIDLTGRSASFEKELKVLPVSSNVYFDPPTVLGIVDIREVTVERELELVIKGVPNGWTASPATVAVTVSAPASRANEVSAAAVASIATVELPDASSSVTVRVDVSFPLLPDLAARAVDVLSVTPLEVQLERSGRSP